MGRKPKYDVKTLQIGEKMPLRGMGKKFASQYIYYFNKKNGGKYRKLVEGEDVFVERIS